MQLSLMGSSPLIGDRLTDLIGSITTAALIGYNKEAKALIGYNNQADAVIGYICKSWKITQ